MITKEDIDAYVSGQLSPADRTAFERLMEQDSELRRMVADYPHIQHMADGMLEAELLAEVQAQNASVQARKPSRPRWPYLLLALLLAAAAYLLYQSGQSNLGHTTPIAQAYQEPIWPVSRSADAQDLVEQAISQYLDGKPTAAIALLDSHTDPDIARYWKAEMYMHQGQAQAALATLPTHTIPDPYDTRRQYLYIIALAQTGQKVAAQTALDAAPDRVKRLFK